MLFCFRKVRNAEIYIKNGNGSVYGVGGVVAKTADCQGITRFKSGNCDLEDMEWSDRPLVVSK